MKSLDLNKPIQTRDGRKARIVSAKGVGPQPLLAVITNADGTEFMSSYSLSGRWVENCSIDRDLVNVPEKITFTGWLNLYPNGGFGRLKTSEENAKRIRSHDCLATVKFTVEANVGDGL